MVYLTIIMNKFNKTTEAFVQMTDEIINKI